MGTEQSTDTADQDTQGDTDAVEPPADVQGPDEVNIADIERRDPNDPLAVGPVDAPVVMVVFSDYQCPYCAKWSNDTLTVLENYVDAGDLRVEWRDVNIFGKTPNALPARPTLLANKDSSLPTTMPCFLAEKFPPNRCSPRTG